MATKKTAYEAPTPASDKQKALQYIDKALEIKSDDYLETMKNVLM